MIGKSKPVYVKIETWQQLNHREAKLINEGLVQGVLFFNIENKKSGNILRYNIEGLISLREFVKFNIISKREFIILLRNIVIALKNVEENHFNKELFSWSIDCTYVEPVSCQVYMMYIPLQPYESKGSLKGFILDLVSACTFFESEEGIGYVELLLQEVNSGVSYTAHMLNDFCNRISEQFLSDDKKNLDTTRCNRCNAQLREDEEICPFCGKKRTKYTNNKNNNQIEIRQSLAQLMYKNEKDKLVGAGKGYRSTLSVHEDENGVVTIYRGSSNASQKTWLENKKCAGKILVSKFPFIIGKMEGIADYIINNSSVSRKHAEIIKEEGKIYIIDLGSTNGTFVNGRKIQPGVKERVYDGTYLKFSDAEYKFHID